MKKAKILCVLKGMGKLSLFAALLFAWSAEAALPHTSQNISLVSGWNAVYVEVSPEQTADELFADWPVDHVSLYDPASFLATRQFSSDWNSQGLSREAMAVWYRNAPEASSFKNIPGGAILVTFCTNSSFLATLIGPPAAPRTTWHVTGTNTVYNFVGFSTSANTGIAAYLEGSPCEEVLSRAYYRIYGDDPDAVPRARELRTSERTVGDGEVLLLPSDKISDWSGVLHVSPINGVNFGQTGRKSSFSIRNDGTTNRTVRIEFARPLNQDQLYNVALLPYVVYMRDMDTAITNSAWTMGPERAPYYGMAYYKKLAPGETWRVEVGLDRNALEEDSERQKGLAFGALLKITEDSAAHAKVTIPIYGETSGEEASDWQNGLWVADVSLDLIQLIEQRWVIESHTEEREVVTTNLVGNVETVTTNMEEVLVATTNSVDSALGEPTRTGGKFKLRLPIHRDRSGKARLLQRVVLAGDVAADGTFNYKLYAGTVSPPDTAKTLMRISSVCLPTETPVIEASQENLWDDYEEGKRTAKFEFTVGAYGATSILRHPYHPQHDGLRWDFVTHSPDGDDVYNYKSDVKPETFSVKNSINLEITMGDGVASWNPEESFNGTCTWTLTGLRHDGKVVVSGPMVIRRVSPNVQLMLK